MFEKNGESGKMKNNHSIRLFPGGRYVLSEDFTNGNGLVIPRGTLVIYEGLHKDAYGEIIRGSKCCQVRPISPRNDWPAIFYPLRSTLRHKV